VIEGVKIDLSYAELRDHLLGRAEHHLARATFYESRAGELDKGIRELDLEDEEMVNAFSNSGRGDPRDGLRRSAKEHRNKRVYYEFLAGHLVATETYRLTENDLARIEMTGA